MGVWGGRGMGVRGWGGGVGVGGGGGGLGLFKTARQFSLLQQLYQFLLSSSFI